MRTCVLGLGNGILRDDGAGLAVVAALEQALAGGRPDPGIDVVTSATAGFTLLDLLAGYERAVIVDAVDLPGLAPGQLVELDPAGAPASTRLRAVHEVDLATALALGRELGMAMPAEVLVFGIQGVDLRTFGEELTPAVAAAVPAAVTTILARLGLGPS